MSALGSVASWIVLGLAAGARTTAAPSLLQVALAARPLPPGAELASVASSAAFRVVLGAATAIELVIDKLPITGDRTAPIGVVVRAASGALCSAAHADAYRRPKPIAALVGGASAVASTYGLFQLRRALRRRAPAFVLGLAEDAIVFGGGALALRLTRSREA
ncbi:MAG TPA: hypothetical protein VG755_32465 [Nannocystaceae bacterium]|nr:hypothetical protein [Nannocystaceae bacterium]